MHGLPPDVDLSFFAGCQLLQVCVGENEVILNLHADISIMIASTVRVVHPGGETDTADRSTDIGPAVLILLGKEICEASGSPDGTLRLVWSDGSALEILDSWKEFESYTVRHGDTLIVV